MAKFCTSLLSLFLTVAHGAIMVGDQHHTAASHFRSWYLWTVSVTEQKYQQLLKIFFSGGGGKAGPSKENIPVNGKEMLTKKDRGLPAWHSVEPRPKNTILGLKFQSLEEEELKVHHRLPRRSSVSSYSVGSQTPRALHMSGPRKRSCSARSTSLTTWAVAFPFTHPSLTSQMFPNDMTVFLSRQRAFGFFPPAE